MIKCDTCEENAEQDSIAVLEYTVIIPSSTYYPYTITEVIRICDRCMPDPVLIKDMLIERFANEGLEELWIGSLGKNSESINTMIEILGKFLMIWEERNIKGIDFYALPDTDRIVITYNGHEFHISHPRCIIETGSECRIFSNMGEITITVNKTVNRYDIHTEIGNKYSIFADRPIYDKAMNR